MIPGEKAGVSVRQRFGATPEQIWKDMVAVARQQERRENLPPIIATDVSEDVVETAHLNAIAAGVAEYMTFGTCDFADTRLPPPPGVIFMNPPYGERLTAGAAVDAADLTADAAVDAPDAPAEEPVPGEPLDELYGRIGDFLKQKGAGYTGCVFTGNMELSRRIGLRSSRRITFYNGPIECRLIVFDLYEGDKTCAPSP
jgi:putative N6-adenine-specific DNA methylase